MRKKLSNLLLCMLVVLLTTLCQNATSHKYSDVAGGKHAENVHGPTIAPRVTVMPGKRIIGMQFQVTANPFSSHSDPRSEVLQHVDSPVIKHCPSGNRIPCGPTDRSTCSRWKCCWNEYSNVPCAEAQFIILPGAQCGSSRYHNPRPRPLQDLRNNLFLGMLGLGSVGRFNSAQFTEATISNRIIDGQEAVANAWPWVVRIAEGSGDSMRQICGGAILNNDWIVSAAHCIITIDPSLYSVILGDHKINEITGREQVSRVTELVYNGYQELNSNNDIVLMKLATPAKYNDFVSPICLPEQGEPTDVTVEGKVSYVGAYGVTVGWGQTENQDGSNNLQVVRLQIMPGPLCKIMATNVNVGDSKFCAGGGFKDTCSGDSGGPFVVMHDDGKYYLHGITSYGTTKECGIMTKPGVYTKVSDHVSWIHAVIG